MPLSYQHKFRYSVALSYEGTEILGYADEVTQPAVKYESITRRNQQYGFLALRAPVSIDEGMIRLAFRTDDDTFKNSLITLQGLAENDSDVISITINMLKENQDVSVTYSYEYCKLTSFKPDPVNVKQDDDFLYIELGFVPQKVTVS